MISLEKLMNSKKGKNPLQKSMYQSYLFKGNSIATYQNYTQNILDGYNSNETIYAIVNKIANAASSVPLKLVDDKGNVVEGNWANRLITYPNADYTFGELYNAYLIYLLTIGNAYLYSPKLSNGTSIELNIMPAAETVAISGGWSNPIAGYKLYIGTQEVQLPKSDIMHQFYFNPNFNDGMFIYGLSPIQVASDMLNNLNAGEKRMFEMLDKGTPPFIISAKTNDGLTPQQVGQLEQKYEEKYGSTSNPNKPLLSGVELKIDKLGFSAQDLSLIENSVYGLRVLCNVYGVDSKMFNDPAASTFNNMNAVYTQFYEGIIKPLNNKFADKLTQFLFSGQGNLHFEFDYSTVSILGTNRAELMAQYNGVTFLTESEKRALFGYKDKNTTV